MHALLEAYENGRVSSVAITRFGSGLRDPASPDKPAELVGPEFLVGGEADEVSSGGALDDAQALDLQLQHDAVLRLTSSNLSVCTGGLLTPQWLVTSAHCVADEIEAAEVGYHSVSRIRVATGLDDCWVPRDIRTLDDNVSEPEGCELEDGGRGIRCDCVAQSDLASPLPSADFALLRLERPVSAQEATPLLLGAPLHEGAWPPSGDDNDRARVRVAGYGLTRQLFSDGQSCEGTSYYAPQRLFGVFRLAAHPLSLAMLQLESEQTDAAPGDSGSPVVALSDSGNPWGREVVVGLLKSSDCHGTQSAVSTLDPDLQEWIREVTGASPHPPLPLELETPT